MYMMDTNILIYAMRHPQSSVVDRLIDHAGKDICISTITLAELELGILRSSNPLRNRQALMAALSGVDILFFDNTAASEFAIIKSDPLRIGTPVEDMDIMIDAHVKSLGYTPVTDNEKRFRGIEGLSIEN